jgi:hypothetical protein
MFATRRESSTGELGKFCLMAGGGEEEEAKEEGEENFWFEVKIISD